MSHCRACDKPLTNTEDSRKHKVTKEEIGLCDDCLAEVLEIQYIPIIEAGEGLGSYLDEPLPTDELLAGDILLQSDDVEE